VERARSGDVPGVPGEELIMRAVHSAQGHTHRRRNRRLRHAALDRLRRLGPHQEPVDAWVAQFSCGGMAVPIR
jgi:hypothetical protein